MKHIGGEIEIKQEGIYSYITDSGRSSIRLILQSGFKAKRFLIPNYLCRVIVDVLKEYKVDYRFYNVNKDFSVDYGSLKRKDYDVLYLISFFGQRNAIKTGLLSDKTLIIEDNVFLPDFDKPKHINKWIGFNSLRKITPLADGSIVKSTVELNGRLIKNGTANFVRDKYKAKEMKYDFIHNHKGNENAYLKLFNKGEEALDKQKNVYSISPRSYRQLLYIYNNLNQDSGLRKQNYDELGRHLYRISVHFKPEHHSFFLISTERRDALRQFLAKKNIFLPVHWPNFGEFDNPLYDTLLSIPIDARYKKEDMQYVAKNILAFLNMGKKKAS